MYLCKDKVHEPVHNFAPLLRGSLLLKHAKHHGGGGGLQPANCRFQLNMVVSKGPQSFSKRDSTAWASEVAGFTAFP